MPDFELTEVRVDVREVDIDDLYVTLGAEESAAVEEGRALVLRIEATVIPSEPGLGIFDAPPWDYVIRTPVSREDVEDAIAKALFEVAEEAAGLYRQPVFSDDLKAAASVRVHGEFPRAPASRRFKGKPARDGSGAGRHLPPDVRRSRLP